MERNHLEKDLLVTKIICVVILFELVTLIVLFRYNVDKELHYSYLKSADRIIGELALIQKEQEATHLALNDLTTESLKLEDLYTSGVTSYFLDCVEDIRAQIRVS